MPSPKNPTDPDFGRFDFRTKVKGFPVWKGVEAEGDRDPAAGTEPNELLNAINIRPVLDGYKCRGGQLKAATNNATSDLDGIWEASDVGAATEEAATAPPPVAISLFGTNVSDARLQFLDILLADGTETVYNIGNLLGSGIDPMYLTDGPTGEAMFIVGSSDGLLYVPCLQSRASDGFHRDLLLKITQSSGYSTAVVALSAYYDPTSTDQGGPHMVVEDGATAGNFFVRRTGNESTINTNTLVYLDASGVVTVDDTLPINYGTGSGDKVDGVWGRLFVCNSTVYQLAFTESSGGDPTANILRKRTGAGIWVDITAYLPAPPANKAFFPDKALVYSSGAYIFGRYMQTSSGGANAPQVLNMSSGDVVTIATSFPAGSSFRGAALFSSKIYFLLNKSDGHLWLGSFDGATWDTAVHDFGSGVSGVGLGPVGSSLYALTERAGNREILKSSGSDVTTWSLNHTIAAPFAPAGVFAGRT